MKFVPNEQGMEALQRDLAQKLQQFASELQTTFAVQHQGESVDSVASSIRSLASQRGINLKDEVVQHWAGTISAGPPFNFT